MRSLGMPGDDLALDPGALVALARLTPWGDFLRPHGPHRLPPSFSTGKCEPVPANTDLGGGRLAILPNRLSRDRPQPQILEAQQHREHPLELTVKMDLVPAQPAPAWGSSASPNTCSRIKCRLASSSLRFSNHRSTSGSRKWCNPFGSAVTASSPSSSSRLGTSPQLRRKTHSSIHISERAAFLRFYPAIGRSRACSSSCRNSGCGARHMVRYVSRKGSQI